LRPATLNPLKSIKFSSLNENKNKSSPGNRYMLFSGDFTPSGDTAITVIFMPGCSSFEPVASDSTLPLLNQRPDGVGGLC
jgi:hypothetical protein